MVSDWAIVNSCQKLDRWLLIAYGLHELHNVIDGGDRVQLPEKLSPTTTCGKSREKAVCVFMAFARMLFHVSDVFQ